MAILNSGDALALEFDAGTLPPLHPGMRRSIFFYSVGWDKDADHNVVDGDTVDPLPMRVESAYDNSLDAETDWRLQYNTRWVPGDRFDRR